MVRSIQSPLFVALVICAVASVARTNDCPEFVGAIDTPGKTQGVAVSGSYAYLANGYEGLRVIDVSTPTDPIEVGIVDYVNYAADVAHAGNYAYLADQVWGIRVIDVSTPSKPFEVGLYDGPWFSSAVEEMS